MSEGAVSREDFAAFRAETRVHLTQINATCASLVPLLHERSGNRSDMDRVRAELQQSDTKHRQHVETLVRLETLIGHVRDAADARMDRIEERMNKALWTLTGAMLALQAGTAVVVWLYESGVIGAGR